MRQLKVAPEVEPVTKFYVMNCNAQSDSGDHEVHHVGCSWFDKIERKLLLGSFESCHEALAAAKRRFKGKKIDGCKYCSPECHTG